METTTSRVYIDILVPLRHEWPQYYRNLFYVKFCVFICLAVGAASNPCFDTFAGPHAASEPETQAISNHVLRLKRSGHLVYYFAFHSYSQMTLVPYSHVSGANVLSAPNYGDLVSCFLKYF